MLKKIIAASALALAASGATAATDYGKYLCTYGCYFPLWPIDVRNFVSMYVNQNVDMWKRFDKFSICDGEWCEKYMTLDWGVTWVFFEWYLDDEEEEYKGEGMLF